MGRRPGEDDGDTSPRELLAQQLESIYATMPHSPKQLAELMRRHRECGCTARGDLCGGCLAVLELGARLEGEGVTVDGVSAAVQVQVPFNERSER